MARAGSKAERRKAVDIERAQSTNKLTSVNGVKISDEQFGKKLRKHASDWGIDPRVAEDREKFADVIADIIQNSDDTVTGYWRGQEGDCVFYIKGNDVVITNNGDFVTVLSNGVSNPTIAKYIREKEESDT